MGTDVGRELLSFKSSLVLLTLDKISKVLIHSLCALSVHFLFHEWVEFYASLHDGILINQVASLKMYMLYINGALFPVNLQKQSTNWI